MRGYSVKFIFSPDELCAYERAVQIVEQLPDAQMMGANGVPMVRCHELARAFAHHLGLHVQDGYYGFVDHSWLWLTRPDRQRLDGRLGLPNILDVYSVGRVPMVSLVDCSSTALPHVGWAYRPGPERDDIDEPRVARLIRLIEHIDPHMRAGEARAAI